MKRVLTFVASALLVMGTATSALAAFDYNTFMSSTNDGTTELLAGLDYSMYEGLEDNTISNYFNQDLSEFGQAEYFADLSFGGIGGNATGSMLENYDIWIAVTDAADVLGTTPGWNGMTTVAASQNTAASALGDTDVQSLNEAISVTSGGLEAPFRMNLMCSQLVNIQSVLMRFDAWTAGDTISLAMDIVHYGSTDWTGTWSTIEDTGADLVITRTADGSIGHLHCNANSGCRLAAGFRSPGFGGCSS